MNPKRREGKIESEESTKNLHLNTAQVDETERGSSWPGISVRLAEAEIDFAITCPTAVQTKALERSGLKLVRG